MIYNTDKSIYINNIINTIVIKRADFISNFPPHIILSLLLNHLYKYLCLYKFIII